MHISTRTDSEGQQPYSYIRLVQSGNRIEVYEYEKQPAENPRRSKVKRRVRSAESRRERRNVTQARDNFSRMVQSSLLLGAPAFCTLTMVGICDISTAYRHFTRFTEALRKEYGSQIAWIAVPEYQRRGAVHFHALIWGLDNETVVRESDTRDIQALWFRGWIDILASDGSPKLATYLAKYMYKSMYDDRFSGEKSYTASRNALRPKYFRIRTTSTEAKETSKERWARIRKYVPVDRAIGHPEFIRVYNTEWLGRCRKKVYRIA